jgi:hypothetical protein
MQLTVFGLPDLTRETGAAHTFALTLPNAVYAAFEIVHFLITSLLITMLYSMNSKLKWKMILFSGQAGERETNQISGMIPMYSLLFSIIKIIFNLQPLSEKEKLDDIPAWAIGLLFVVDMVFYLVICARQCISIRIDPFRNEPEDMLDTYFLPWDGLMPCGICSWRASAYRNNVLPEEQLSERDYWGEQALRDASPDAGAVTQIAATPAGVAATQAAYAPSEPTVLADASVVTLLRVASLGKDL